MITAQKNPRRTLGIVAVLGLLVSVQAFLIGEDGKLRFRSRPTVTVVAHFTAPANTPAAASVAASSAAAAAAAAPAPAAAPDSPAAPGAPAVSPVQGSLPAAADGGAADHPGPVAVTSSGDATVSGPALPIEVAAAPAPPPSLPALAAAPVPVLAAPAAARADGDALAPPVAMHATAADLAPALTTQAFVAAPDAAPAIRGPQATPGRPATYKVREGDTLFGIARRFGLSAEAVREANGISGSILAIGAVLSIPRSAAQSAGPGRTLHALREGETAIDVARIYHVPLIDLVTDNDLADVYHIPAGTQLKVRTAHARAAAAGESVGSSSQEIRPSAPPRPRVPAVKPLVARAGFSPPIRGRISSKFGYREHPILGECRFHGGVDIPADMGEAVHAAAAGQVVFAGWQPGLGKTIVVRHGAGFVTRYGHCSRLMRRRGDWIKRGDTIALVGSTGLSTGPHLHFEIQRNGRLQNPLRYIARASFRPPEE